MTRRCCNHARSALPRVYQLAQLHLAVGAYTEAQSLLRDVIRCGGHALQLDSTPTQVRRNRFKPHKFDQGGQGRSELRNRGLRAVARVMVPACVALARALYLEANQLTEEGSLNAAHPLMSECVQVLQHAANVDVSVSQFLAGLGGASAQRCKPLAQLLTYHKLCGDANLLYARLLPASAVRQTCEWKPSDCDAIWSSKSQHRKQWLLRLLIVLRG